MSAPVTQAAREAAGALLGPGMNEGVYEGRKDSLSVVRHFAMFEAEIRIAAETASAARVEALEAQCLDRSMLAHRWMVAHDSLKAGKPYSFPSTADLPEALARLDASAARVAELERRAALYRGALIDLTAEVYAGEGGEAFLRAWEIFADEGQPVESAHTTPDADDAGGV